jgi:hypothetical protein
MIMAAAPLWSCNRVLSFWISTGSPLDLHNNLLLRRELTKYLSSLRDRKSPLAFTVRQRQFRMLLTAPSGDASMNSPTRVEYQTIRFRAPQKH